MKFYFSKKALNIRHKYSIYDHVKFIVYQNDIAQKYSNN